MTFNNYQFNGYLRSMFSITTVMGRKENITDLHSFFLQYKHDTLNSKLDLVVKTANSNNVNIFQELIYWSKQYDIDYKKRIINSDLRNLLILGIEAQKINLPNDQNIEVIDFYIHNSGIQPNEETYNKLLLIKLVHEAYPQYLNSIDNILSNWNKKAAFDKDKQLYIKEYLHSFPIDIVDTYPELKHYYKSLETNQYLKSEELSHYRINIDTNVIANINNIKSKVALIKTLAALSELLKLLDNQEIFNYLGEDFSKPTYKKNKFDQSSSEIQLDFLFENDISKNIFKEITNKFLEYVVNNLEESSAFTKTNIKTLIDKLCLEKQIDSTKKEFKNNNKIKI